MCVTGGKIRKKNEHQRYRELLDWLFVLKNALDGDADASSHTISELHESLVYAETALRRAIAEQKDSNVAD